MFGSARSSRNMGRSTLGLSSLPTFSSDRTQEIHSLRHGARQRRLRRLGTWLENRPTWLGAPPSTLRDLEMRLIDPRHAANRAAIHFLQRGRRRPEPGPTRQHERCMLCVVPSRKRALMFSRIPPSQLSCNRVAALPTRYSIPGPGKENCLASRPPRFLEGLGQVATGLRHHPAGDNALRRSLSASVCSCQR